MSRAPYTMPSATAFLPSRMTTLTNLVIRRRTSGGASVNLGSGRTLRLGTSPLRGMAGSWPARLLRALRAVLRARLLAVLHAGGVERAADDVVANAGEILDAAAADQDDRVLLQVVPLARDVRRDLHTVGQPHARDLAQRGVGLLGRRGVHAGADAALLRALLEGRRRTLHARLLAAVADELIDRGHRGSRGVQSLGGSGRHPDGKRGRT